MPQRAYLQHFLEIIMKTLYSINEFDSMYCDGLVTKSGNIIFGSFWGRDTTILECLAKFQLPVANGGLSSVNIGGINAYVNADKLKKQTGRVFSQVFGNLVQLWLFEEQLQSSASVKGKHLSLIDGTLSVDELPLKLLWRLINHACPFPLLDVWSEHVINHCVGSEYISVHPGLNVSCIEITIDEDNLGEFLSEGIKTGLLVNEVSHD